MEDYFLRGFLEVGGLVSRGLYGYFDFLFLFLDLWNLIKCLLFIIVF